MHMTLLDPAPSAFLRRDPLIPSPQLVSKIGNMDDHPHTLSIVVQLARLPSV